MLWFGIILFAILMIANPLGIDYIEQPLCDRAQTEAYGDVYVCWTGRLGRLSPGFFFSVAIYATMSVSVVILASLYLFSVSRETRRVIAYRANAKTLGLLDDEEK